MSKEPIFIKEPVLEDVVNENGVYTIPVEWTMTANIKVEGKNLQDALNRARAVTSSPAFGLPKQAAHYLDDSFTIPDDYDTLSTAQSYQSHSEVLIKTDDTVDTISAQE